ncbi:MAG: energy transducer TonB [Myxococcota bacterium]
MSTEGLRAKVGPAALSFLGHGITVIALIQAEQPQVAATKRSTEMRFVELPADPPEPPPSPPEVELPPPTPEPQRATRPRRTRRRLVPAEPAPAPPTPLQAPEPIAFDNVVVANGPGPGFSVPTGQGAERSGTTRAVRRVERTSSNAISPARNGGGVVPVSDLARAPGQPGGIRARLVANYPSAARREGRTGQAMVRLRIDSSGTARVLQVLSASSPEFGQACRRTLDGQNGWRPGRSRGGVDVSTIIRFNCAFSFEG